MRQDYIEIGPGPCNEECAQVGSPNYRTNALRECQTYIQAIRNYLGQEPDGALLSYKWFPHDSGSYVEVVCFYDIENEQAREYAFKCEAKAPMTWEDGGVMPPRREGQTQRSR